VCKSQEQLNKRDSGEGVRENREVEEKKKKKKKKNTGGAEKNITKNRVARLLASLAEGTPGGGWSQPKARKAVAGICKLRAIQTPGKGMSSELQEKVGSYTGRSTKGGGGGATRRQKVTAAVRRSFHGTIERGKAADVKCKEGERQKKEKKSKKKIGTCWCQISKKKKKQTIQDTGAATAKENSARLSTGTSWNVRLKQRDE